jgi:hypothetical protein
LTLFDAQHKDTRIDIGVENGIMSIVSLPLEEPLALQNEKAFIKGVERVMKSF